MKLMGTSGVTAAAALFAGLLMTSAVGAAPLSSSQAAGQQANSQSEPMLQTVRDGRHGGRHGGWRGHRHHRGWGGAGWGAAAAAGLLLGAPLLSEGYGPAYGYGYDDDDDDVGYGYRGRQYSGGGEARCEATFRSYDPSSGTYMGYDGVRRVCPYL